MIEIVQSGRDEDGLAALRAEAERLRLALKSARVFAWDWDIRANRIVWADGLAPEMGVDDTVFGGTLSEFLRLVHPDDRGRVADRIEAAVEGVAEYDLRFRMVRTDGSVRWTATRGIVVRDPAGRPVRMIGTDRDITAEMHRAEGEGLAAAIPGRAVLDALCDCIELLDLDGRVVWRNVVAAETFGSVAAGEAWRANWPGTAQVKVDRALSAGLDQEFSRFTAQRRDCEGSEWSWEVRVSPVQDEHGDPILLVLSRRMTG